VLSDLEKEFSALEARREDLMTRLGELDDRALAFKPPGDSWSLLQVADHVLRSEAVSLEYMRKKLPHVGPSSRSGLRSKWAFPLLRVVLSLPLRLKMPASIRDSLGPGEHIDLDELGERWVVLRSRLRDLLEGMPAELMKAPLFRHPIAGSMDLVRALRFLEAHFDHHLRQVDRLCSHPDFPMAKEI
jgi:hypothetical protein